MLHHPKAAPLGPPQNVGKTLTWNSWVWTSLGDRHHVGPRTTMLTNPPTLVLGVAQHTPSSHLTIFFVMIAFIGIWSPACNLLLSALPMPTFPQLLWHTYIWIYPYLDMVWVLSLKGPQQSGKTESAIENWNRCHLALLHQDLNPSFIPVGASSNRSRRECGHCCHLVCPLEWWLREIKASQIYVSISQSVSLILLPSAFIFLQKGVKLKK